MPRVIVIDPGHGGSNEGLNYRGFIEKDMNLIVANAMKDTLSQYDDVEVYITNPEKKDMSLKERAQYADSVGADVIICLHFNMSEEHQSYGSEVWIPSTGLGYAKMRSLGDIFVDQFAQKGLTVRGVKTRLNDEGLDYYGIIRESQALGVPCVLVEHAYADHDRDLSYINSEENLKSFGVLDAQAVAKFYGLKSTSLGTDYSGFVKNGYFAPEEAVGSDKTEPMDAVLIWEGIEGEYTIEDSQQFIIGANEEESSLVYYDYSIDGGQTWSELLPFERRMTQMEIVIPGIVPGSEVFARIYNGHNLYAETNTIKFTPFSEEELREVASHNENSEITGEMLGRTEQAGEKKESGDLQQIASEPDRNLQNTKITPYLFCGFGLFLASMLFLTAYLTYRMGDRRKTAKRERLLFITGVCVLLMSATSLGVVYVSHHSRVTQTTLESESAEENKNEESVSDLPYAEQSEITEQERLALLLQKPYELKLDGDNGSKEKLPTKLSSLLPEEETAVIYDIAEGFLRVPLLEDVAENPYQLNAFTGSGLDMRYSGGDKNAMMGIDVSKFQGDIDFGAVKEAGIEFVIIRQGLRGYGSGELVTDERFYSNLQKAQEAGLRTGVYFFSSAINEEEAVEEAHYVLSAIDGYEIDMPIVFDTEPILHDTARTDNLTPDQLTKITRAFCNEIQNNGYHPMIYANAKRFTTVLHLDKLTEFDLWLADYRQAPDFPYAFKMWQFTEHGSVPGIETEVDINLYFE